MADNKIYKIVFDAMGGDNGPSAIVEGAVNALSKSNNIKIILVGKAEIIESELKKYSYDESRIEVVNATEVIEMEESPVLAIRRKKDSSIVVGQKLVKDGLADAFISAGSTGAVLAGGTFVVGRAPGVERAPIGAIYPTMKGAALLIDCGANVDASSEQLRQFAIMGSIYYSIMFAKENPTVGLLNIGVEEEKGNALAKETFQVLKNEKQINFVGNIESREFANGPVDVLVTDAFTGNVALKLYEGTGKALIDLIKGTLMSSFKTKIGALLIKKSLKQTLKRLDPSEYGGAPMLGLNGLVMKAHGSSTAKEISNAIIECENFLQNDIVNKIKNALCEGAGEKEI